MSGRATRGRVAPRGLIFSILTACCVLTSCRSTWNEGETIQEEVARAADLASSDIRGAIRLLEQSKSAPSARVQFTIGVFYETLAQNELEPERAREARLQAAEHWERVLEIQPGHVPSLQNLAVVYAELGPDFEDEAFRVIGTAYRDVPESDATTQYAIRMIEADLLVRIGRLAEAKDILEEALARWPEDSAAASRLLVIAELEGHEQLEDAARRFAGDYPEVARRGYEVLMHKLVPGEAANEYLGDWLVLEAGLDSLSALSFERLPMETAWEGTAYTELLRVVTADDPSGFGALDYWTSPPPLRRHQIAVAVRALGERLELAGDPQRAMQYYKYGLLPAIAPEYEDYARDETLEGLDKVRLGLLLDQLVLIHTNPNPADRAYLVQPGFTPRLLLVPPIHVAYALEDVARRLDPDRSLVPLLATIDTEWLTEESFLLDEHLFSKPERVKFHSTLGQIYGERGAWDRGQWHAAPLHLERAARIADEIEQPRPDLWLLLAEGLEADGVPLEALEAYLASATGLLDLKERPAAKRVLPPATDLERDTRRLGDERLLAIEDSIYTPEGWYLGGTIGYADGNKSEHDFEDDLAADGFDASIDLDDDNIGAKLFVGYRFDRTWAVEFSAVTIGDQDSKVDGPGGDDFEDAVEDRHPLVGRGVGVAVLRKIYERRRFKAFGKLGYWRWDSDVEINDDGDEASVDGTDFFYGLGVQYDFGEQIGLRAEVERYELDDNDVDMISLGFTVDF